MLDKQHVVYNLIKDLVRLTLSGLNMEVHKLQERCSLEQTDLLEFDWSVYFLR